MGMMSSHELYLDMRANKHKLYDDNEWEMKEVRQDREMEGSVGLLLEEQLMENGDRMDSASLSNTIRPDGIGLGCYVVFGWMDGRRNCLIRSRL